MNNYINYFTGKNRLIAVPNQICYCDSKLYFKRGIFMKKLLFIALCALPLNIQSMEEVKNKEQECEEHKSFLATLNCKGPQELSFLLHYNAINGDQIRLLPRETRQATESNVANLITSIQEHPDIFSDMIKMHAKNTYDLRPSESEKRNLKDAILGLKTKLSLLKSESKACAHVDRSNQFYGNPVQRTAEKSCNLNVWQAKLRAQQNLLRELMTLQLLETHLKLISCASESVEVGEKLSEANTAYETEFEKYYAAKKQELSIPDQPESK